MEPDRSPANRREDWRRAGWTTFSEELVGQPGRWSRLKDVISMMVAFGVVLAMPRLDQWPRGQASVWPTLLVVVPFVRALGAARGARLGGQTGSEQMAVALGALLANMVIAGVLAFVSLTFGPPPGQSQFERVNFELAGSSLWPVVIGLALIAVLWRYRSMKREEAVLRTRAASRSAVPDPPT